MDGRCEKEIPIRNREIISPIALPNYGNLIKLLRESSEPRGGKSGRGSNYSGLVLTKPEKRGSAARARGSTVALGW